MVKGWRDMLNRLNRKFNIVQKDGKNLTELEVTLAPSTIWVHENCYPLAVIWKKNGSDYEFINQSK